MDYTLKTYKKLLSSVISNNYAIVPFKDYITDNHSKCVILRHDIERNPHKALTIAKIEREYGVSTSYYFRISENHSNAQYIQQIEKLGHEIGYHYEDLSIKKGNFDSAILHFKERLDYFRQFYPVQTISMHGSPKSKWDNKLLWQRNNYQDFGLIGEPNFDIDFNKVFYITDASRSWNNGKVTIRDKINSNFKLNIKSTDDIIRLLNSDEAPKQIMINIHPHNWASDKLSWSKIYLWQYSKNIVKWCLIKVNQNNID